MKCWLAGLMVLAAVGIGPVNAAVYRVTDLGTLGGRLSHAYAINDSGQVVGESQAAGSAAYHAFLYSGSTMTDLGTLVEGANSAAHAINERGQVVGSADVLGNEGFGIVPGAFLYSGGTMIRLIVNMSFNEAHGINDSGQIVGQYGNTDVAAFLYSGTMLPLPTWGEDSSAHGINNSGQVVGAAQVSHNGPFHAFLYSGSTITDLSTLGGTESSATAINDNGQIVGWANTASNAATHAFLYSGSKMTDLGTLGGLDSYASAINDSGQVVGWVGPGGIPKNRAFLFSGNTMTDLNDLIDPTSGWTLHEAADINNQGQIVGIGTNLLGQRHAFLLTKVVPEPSTLALGVLGVLAIALGWWRKRRINDLWREM